ncbi:MAG: TonB-dependent receptor [Bacteroidia bacterium]
MAKAVSFIAIWGCLFAQVPCAANYGVAGYARYDKAIVEILPLGWRDTVDSNSYFHFHGVCRGTYTIRVLVDGHFIVERQVHVPVDSLILFEPPEVIHTIVIEGHVPYVTHLNPLMTGIHAENGLAGHLRQMPGITFSQVGPLIVKPILEGMQRTRIAYWQAGQPLASHQWGDDHAPEVDPFSAEEMEVRIGPSPVRHGTEALGGAIILPAPAVCCLRETQVALLLSGIANGRGGNLALRLQSAWKGWGYRLQGSLLRLGTMRAPTYYLTGIGTAQAHGSLTIHKLWEHWQLHIFYAQYNARIGVFKGMHIGNLTDLSRAIEARIPLVTSEFSYQFSPPYQDVVHELVSFSLSYLTSKNGLWNLLLGRQYNRRTEHDLVGIYTSSRGIGLDLQLTTHFAQLSYQKGNWTVGAFIQHQRNFRQYAYFIPTYERWQGGMFCLYHREKWEIGLRMEPIFYSFDQTILQTGGMSVSGLRRGFSPFAIEINRDGKLRTHLSLISRAPNPAELYAYGYHQAQAAFHIGANHAHTEPTIGLRASWERSQLNAGVGLYYSPAFIWQRLGEPILSLRGASLSLLYEQSPATWFSISMRWSKPLSQHFSWELRGAYLWGSVYQAGWQPMPLLPPPILTPSIQGKYAGWKAEIYWQYQFRQMRYALNAEYIPPPPGYGLLGAQVSRHLKRWQIIISGENLLNQSYRAYPDLMRFFADQSGRQLKLTLLYEAALTRREGDAE